MFAVGECVLPETGGSMFVVIAGLFVLIAGVIVTRWVRQSAGRLSVVVAPLVLLGGFVLAPQVVDPCAPEPLLANGTLPELCSGAGQMTKEDGTVSQVPVQQVGQQVQIGTSEFYMALSLGTGSVSYDNSCIILNLGAETIVTGVGFKPGSTVKVWLFSTPTLLGTTIVLQDGTFSLPVTVPGNTPAGPHTLQAEGLTTAGDLRALSARVTVSNDVVSPVAPATTTTTVAAATTTTTTTPTLPTQTVTWSPTTALTTAQSPNTPLVASSSGDGAITYAVQSAGATGCAINSSTRVLTFTAAGSCVVRATAATTSNYLTGYIDVTFTVTLAAPAFTLSSSSESKAQNVAIAGYTITSTGGTIASYAISPPAPAGLTFSTSTGLLTGTPTTVQSATVYTITATGPTGTATRTFTLTVRVAAPAFTLSSSSESKVQNVAIAGYTITSTGGTIASYAISPDAPAGLSFSTSTGLLTGTPTEVQSATAYTITATNATGTATQTFTLTVTAATCAEGGACVVGDTGPGGGIVFYVQAAGGTFNCGPTLTLTCKYLEVAPSGWDTGAATKLWAVADKNSSDIAALTNETSANNGSGIGLGYKNSIAIVNQGNDTTTAAGAARAYAGGSKSDWYLPSPAELNQMCKWQRGVAWTSDATVCTGGTLNTGTGASGFLAGEYWSSAEYNNSFAWRQDFSNGNRQQVFKSNTLNVRPVRAF